MATVLPKLSAFSLLLFLLSHLSLADHISPVLSISQAPSFGGPAPQTIQVIEVSSAPSYPSLPPSSSPSPSPSPDLSSSHPLSSPSPSPSDAPESAPSPVPAPVDSEVRNVDESDLKSEVAAKETDDGDAGVGMSGGMKAILAIGLLAGAGILCLGTFVYIKRKENTRRARYGYAAREDLL